MTNNEKNVEHIRQDWLDCLQQLISDVRKWATEDGWVTRQIEFKKRDTELGTYTAPALLLQSDATRVLLEPIARSAPGARGVVDLYLMPAYDDIATLYLEEDGWRLHYMSPTSPTVADIREAESKSLNSQSLREVLDEMKRNVVH